MEKAWKSEGELADLIMTRVKANKDVRLSAQTAHFVALKLYTADKKPTVREIVTVICDSKCERPCYLCTGKANVIVRAYGHSVEGSLDRSPEI